MVAPPDSSGDPTTAFTNNKPNSQAGCRLAHHLNHNKSAQDKASNSKVEKSTHAHTSSFDMTSNRRNRDLTSDEPNGNETLSPKSVVNSIINQCYIADSMEAGIDADLASDSMFELSQQLAERYNPAYKTMDQPQEASKQTAPKSSIRPRSISRKKVTFDVAKFGDAEGAIHPPSIKSESMSESFSSAGDEEETKQSNRLEVTSNRDVLRIKRNEKRLSMWYKPALMTK